MNIKVVAVDLGQTAGGNNKTVTARRGRGSPGGRKMEGHLGRALVELFYASAEVERGRASLEGQLGANRFQLLSRRLRTARAAVEMAISDLQGDEKSPAISMEQQALI